MTRFLDVRLDSVGGDLATTVAISQGTNIGNYQSYNPTQLQSDVRGRNILIGTHGFKVTRQDGIACLSNWEGLLQLAPSSIFLGLLWPGDSIWAHGLDYPLEPRVADDAGRLIGPFIDANFAGAASVSFASHSLGARVILQTVLNMSLPVRRVMLMAGAIDDNCLITEFQDAAAKIQTISVLASTKDDVLSELFPLGNFVGGIIAAGHPWWHAALGHRGPASPKPGNLQAPFQIPDGWDYGHHNYLQVDAPPSPWIATPADVPAANAPAPCAGADGWQEAWSAAFCSTRFR
jgi:hypothetical protein